MADSLELSLLVRGAACWAGTRLLLFAVGVPVGGPGALICVAVSATVAEIAARRRNLHRLLPNLGVPRSVVWSLHLVPAVVGEAAVFAVTWP